MLRLSLVFNLLQSQSICMDEDFKTAEYKFVSEFSLVNYHGVGSSNHLEINAKDALSTRITI